MFDMVVLVPIAIGVVIVVLILYASHYQNKKRREAMHAFAESQGWQWTEEDQSYVNQWQGEPFGRGSSRKVRNVLTGRHRELDFIAFDYSYVTRSGGGSNSSSSTYPFTVWAVRMPKALPHLELGPEGAFGGRVAALFGMSDLQVGDEQFDAKFKVRSADEEFAKELLQGSMRDFLLRNEVRLRFDGNTLLCWEKGRVNTALLAPKLEFVGEFIGLVPSLVWERYGRAA